MIKSFKQTQSTRKDISNILDSFNDENAKEFETMLEREISHSKERDRQMGIGRQFGASATIPVEGVMVGLSSMTNFNASSQTIKKDAIRTLNRSVGKQVQKSTANRKVEVNTEVTLTETESEETTTTRILENINKSRVLNFVFRQLNQQLLTVTYLEDVSFVFVNGYEECTKKATLATLKDFLEEILVAPTPVFEDIINHLHNTYNYAGLRVPYVDKVTLSYENLFPITSTITQDVFVRSSAIANSVVPNTDEISSDGNALTVNGVIVDITYRTLPTDSVVVDAILGQGEALDCYNMKLQDAAVAAVQLENSEKQQAINIIDGIENVNDKATLYKKVFTNCCDVPQSGCGCNEPSNPL